jgi:hypothetical protein
MEKFWAVILIFVIVAAGGLLYVNQVYYPQRTAQMAMADIANNTLSAVEGEIGNNSEMVSVSDVKKEVKRLCDEDNDIEITVKTEGTPKKYTKNSEGIDDQLSGITNKFWRTPEYDDDDNLVSIYFKKI